MAIFPDIGRAFLAGAVAAQPLLIGWGRGLEAWGATPPAEPMDATELVDVVGYRLPDIVRFVTPDAAGDLQLRAGERYRIEANPTPFLWVEATWDFADGAGTTIREFALFGAPVLLPHPPGQRYFLPGELDGQGRMLYLERVPPIVRTSATQYAYRLLLQF